MARVSILLTDGVRLANKLYMHACVYAWCLEAGHTLIDPCMHPYARHYPSLRGNLLCSPHHALRTGTFLADTCRLGWLTWLVARGLGKRGILGRVISPLRGEYDPIPIPPTGPEPTPAAANYAINRWGIQNQLGMMKHRDAILRHLTPNPEIVHDADRFAASLPEGRLALAVHIRHGDHRTALRGLLFVPLEDTLREMRRVHAALADLNPLFVVFSDEPRRPEEFPGLDVVISKSPAINDLYRMARFPLIVGPMSSFNLWAAYAGGGRDGDGGPGLAYQFQSTQEGIDLMGWYTDGLRMTRSFDEAVAFARERHAAGPPQRITAGPMRA